MKNVDYWTNVKIRRTDIKKFEYDGLPYIKMC